MFNSGENRMSNVYLYFKLIVCTCRSRKRSLNVFEKTKVSYCFLEVHDEGNPNRQLLTALKKKHLCTNHQPTILRNIGVNVYPAVNAYTADELLASALPELNNIIPLSNSNVCQLMTEEK